MRVEVNHRCSDYNSYRAARVKSLFNAESGCNWSHVANLPIDELPWKIGLIVGPSGSGKTSIGRNIFDSPIHDLYAGWDNDKPIVDCIAEGGDFNQVTGALSDVGLGDVPAWLRPFSVLSNGEKFRAGLARSGTRKSGGKREEVCSGRIRPNRRSQYADQGKQLGKYLVMDQSAARRVMEAISGRYRRLSMRGQNHENSNFRG